MGRAGRGAREANATIIGRISGKVKGGFTVDIKDVRAFLPGSLVDVRPVRDPVYLEGKELEFKLIKLDRKRNNVVVSRRAVVESEHSEEREQLMEKLVEGAVLKGVVKNLTDYGAFVDLGGIDGLLHITDMAWKRVRHPSEVVEVGQELDVRVLKYDRERNRVSLGLKQLGEDPWDNIARRYPANSRVFGKVSNVTDYGAFVEIEPGVEGLVHVSEMDWTNKNVNPSKVVQVGDEVEVMVLDVDEERRRISLGIKQVTSNPWETFAAIHKKGDKVSGQIKSITDFGIFIGLDGGIDGLIHLSDISWNSTGEDIARNYKKGDTLEAVVLAVDPERERISLGVKQMEQDPLGQFMAANPKGSQGQRHRQGSRRQGRDHRPGRGRRRLRVRARHQPRAHRRRQPASEGRRRSRGQVRRHGPQGPQPAAVDQGQGRRRDRRSAGRVQQGPRRCRQRHHQAGRAAARAAEQQGRLIQPAV